MKQALTLFISFLAAWASAQYSIGWYKIAGGGGTSSGGSYQVSGTAGQHDAGGPLTGASYSLTGGFWYVASVPGAPWLRLFLTTTNTVVVAWPASSSAFRLQQNSSPGTPPDWSSVTNALSVVSGENQVTISPLIGHQFYRLINP